MFNLDALKAIAAVYEQVIGEAGVDGFKHAPAELNKVCDEVGLAKVPFLGSEFLVHVFNFKITCMTFFNRF